MVLDYVGEPIKNDESAQSKRALIRHLTNDFSYSDADVEDMFNMSMGDIIKDHTEKQYKRRFFYEQQ
jgi:hypothetical protein